LSPFRKLLLEALLQASFPRLGDTGRVGELIEADVGVDAPGIGAHRSGGVVRIAYPIAVVADVKPAEPSAASDGGGLIAYRGS
jgi:hypothetical protein